jgi:hypothetical protein
MPRRVAKEIRSAQLLESLETGTFDRTTKTLLRGSDFSDSERVMEFIRSFIFTGSPDSAEIYVKKTGITLDWQKEKDVILLGYGKIVDRATRSQRTAGVDKSEFNRLKAMNRLTGINIQEEENLRIIRFIAALPYRMLIPTVRDYMDSVNPYISHEAANILYDANRYYKKELPDSDPEHHGAETQASRLKRITALHKINMEKAILLFGIIKVKPAGTARQNLFDSYKNMERLFDYEPFLHLFTDPSKPAEVKKLLKMVTPLSETEKAHIDEPVCLFALKIIAGVRLSDFEIKALERYFAMLAKYASMNSRFSGCCITFVKEMHFLRKNSFKQFPLIETQVDQIFKSGIWRGGEWKEWEKERFNSS